LKFDLLNKYKRVLKGYNGSWDLAILAPGKWGLRHLGWELATGKGKNVVYNGNGKDVLLNLQII